MDEILREFLTESGENLDQVERDLVTLERTPDSRPLLASIFRNVHTIKGGSGFLALGKLERVAHAGETLLSALRDGKVTADAEMTDALLALIDTLRQMLGHIERTETESGEDHADLIKRLKLIETAGAASAEKTKREQSRASPKKAVQTPGVPEKPRPSGPPEKMAADDSAQLDEKSAKNAVAPVSADSNVRINVNLLDRLMNLVGELVLARNQMVQVSGAREEADLLAASQRIDLITTDLQVEVMKTRLQPINRVWAKFPRVVRDVSHEVGKSVRLELEGRETKLDRTIIEAITDPLIHIVRNSIDHGIGSPEERRKVGKPEEGVLRMSAFHKDGQVKIEIRDDGKGIDPAKIKAKAVENGLITADQAAQLSDRDSLQLIFHAGFSTAETVTSISGRGVGMDVVKTNIEGIGGSIELISEVGEGTTVRIKIPLTLAIIPALMVESGDERYAIPQVNLVELVSVASERAGTAIESILGTPVYRLRGRLLPLVRLSEMIGAESRVDENASVNIVVLQTEGRQFGLIVDGVGDSQEIVVKPLGSHLIGISVFVGATIMGDGQVALILDVPGLAREARVFSTTRERSVATQAPAKPSESTPRQRLLVFGLGDAHRMALDLSTVGRLERIPRGQLERAGENDVVQYRDGIMTLLNVAKCLGYESESAGDEELHVIVHSDEDRNVGLVVGHIVDIVEETIALETDGARPGVLGRAVIRNRVTELIDAPEFVRLNAPKLELAC